jgi:hypothetical protein
MGQCHSLGVCRRGSLPQWDLRYGGGPAIISSASSSVSAPAAGHRYGVSGLLCCGAWIVHRAVVVRGDGEGCAYTLAVNDDCWFGSGAWRGWFSVGIVHNGFYLVEVAALNGSGFLLSCTPPSAFDLDKLGAVRQSRGR